MITLNNCLLDDFFEREMKIEDRFGGIETLRLKYESQHVTLITAHYDKCRYQRKRCDDIPKFADARRS
jgi:hypothetical protein